MTLLKVQFGISSIQEAGRVLNELVELKYCNLDQKTVDGQTRLYYTYEVLCLAQVWHMPLCVLCALTYASAPTSLGGGGMHRDSIRLDIPNHTYRSNNNNARRLTYLICILSSLRDNSRC